MQLHLREIHKKLTSTISGLSIGSGRGVFNIGSTANTVNTAVSAGGGHLVEMEGATTQVNNN